MKWLSYFLYSPQDHAGQEQWILWIIVNVVSTIMWVYLLYNGQPHAALMVGMWLFYLANSINGYCVWHKAATRNF